MKSEKTENPVLGICRKIGNVIELIEENFITLFTLVIGAFIVLNLALRAFGVQGLSWIEEIARYMLIVTTLIGCSIAAKHKGHMVMDTLVTALPVRAGHVLRAVGYLICGGMYLYLSYFGYRWLLRLISMNRIMETVNLPLWPVWVFVVYAVAVMGLRYIIACVNSVMDAVRGEKIRSEQDEEIERAMAEEAERRKAIEGGQGGTQQ